MQKDRHRAIIGFVPDVIAPGKRGERDEVQDVRRGGNGECLAAGKKAIRARIEIFKLWCGTGRGTG